MARGRGARRGWAGSAAVTLFLAAPFALAACGDGGTEDRSVEDAGPSVAPPSPSPSSTSGSTSSASTTASSAGPVVEGAVDAAQPGEVADEVHVECDGSGARLSTDAVRARPDGIHVTVHNMTDEEISLNFVDRGDVVGPGTTETVQVMAPRSLVVSCGYDLNRRIAQAGAVEVVDPDGVWRRTDVDCSRLPLTSWEAPLGGGSTPEEAVRWWLRERPESLRHQLDADAEIIVVGYPDAESPIYVTRDAGLDADIFQVFRRGDGWQAIPHEGCPRIQP